MKQYANNTLCIFTFCMAKKYKVGVVNYLNTKPLLYGFKQGMMADEIEWIEHYPSAITTLLQQAKIDIGLIPIVSIPVITQGRIFSNYCIASNNEVASVCLFSHVPLQQIDKIYLDYQSQTSIALLKILVQHYWKLNVELLPASIDFISRIEGSTAAVIIGDRALQQLNHFPYIYDLAEAWKQFSSLPMVFATWVSVSNLSNNFIGHFNETIQYGLNHIPQLISEVQCAYYDLKRYYTHNISYHFDAEKKKSLSYLLSLLKP